jgi:hypothetical protein
MIPFEIPDRFLVAVANGAMRRIGTTLRDDATGRIAGFLQETGRFQRTVGTGGPGGVILSAGQLASSIYANVQLSQMKSMLAALQMLNVASLAASAVGIGVNVAGFALVLGRLDQIDKGIDAAAQEVRLTRKVAERIDVLVATRDRAKMEALLQEGEDAWLRSDPVQVWKELEGPLFAEQVYWQALLMGKASPPLFRDPRFTLEEAVAAYETVLVLASAHIHTLLLIEEEKLARHRAAEFRRWNDQLIFDLRAIDLATARSDDLAKKEGMRELDARARLLRLSKCPLPRSDRISG